jgi:N-acetylglucosaminyl-diphospho-decaprenol L-rhamnosyltransferase
VRAIPTVIVSYNVSGLLAECLDSVYKVEDLALEPWVVDNASSDHSADMVAARFPDARLIGSDKNLGFAGGNNVALREVSGADHVLLLNPDTVLPRRGVRQLLDVMESNAAIGAVGAQLICPDGSLQQSWRTFPNVGTVIGSSVFRAGDERGVRHTQPARVDWIVGACMLLKGDWLRRVGLLDEGYFMYFEEVDWCRRLEAAGGQTWFCPTVRVIHYGGASVEAIAADGMTAAGLRYRDFLLSEFRYMTRSSGRAGALFVLSVRTCVTLAGILRRWSPRKAADTADTDYQERRRLLRATLDAWSRVFRSRPGGGP